MAFYLTNRAWDNTRKRLEKMVKTIKNIKTMEELRQLKLDDNKRILILVEILQMKNEDEIDDFIEKLILFIIKWRELYAEAESDPITRIEDYFFSTDI